MFSGITLLAALSALTAHDFCYYRCTGRGETFAMQMATLTTNAASRARFWAKVASDKMPVIYQLTFRRGKAGSTSCRRRRRRRSRR